MKEIELNGHGVLLRRAGLHPMKTNSKSDTAITMARNRRNLSGVIGQP